MHPGRFLPLLTLAVLASPASFSQEPGCQLRNGTITTTECFEQIRNDRDVQLNETYQRILRALKERAVAEPRLAVTRRRLIEAQRAWIAFRDQDCNASSSLSTTDSDRLADQTACLMLHTRQRLLELQVVDRRLQPPQQQSTFQVASADESVAGQPLSVWLQRYWQWAHSFPADRSPSGDATGSLCGVRQTQPVFFLTGSDNASRIERTCTVPRDKPVLLPVINVLGQASGPQVDCNVYENAVRQANDSATDLSLIINAVPVDLSAARVETGCFELADARRGATGLAAGAGYWILLKPLQPGPYAIHFSGRYQSDGFSQNVSYRLIVE